MARTRVVTRTINEYKYEVLTLNTVTCEPQKVIMSLTGDELSLDKALKELKKIYETDDVSLVKATFVEKCEQIYGMLETDFLKLATKMDADRHFEETED